jgi:hypothetical protein
MPEPAVDIIKRHGFERITQRRVNSFGVRGSRPRINVLTFDQHSSVDEKPGE